MALLGFAFGIALLSCGRDVTSPGASVRYARGISWHTDFPPAYQLAGAAASGVVDFNRVRVVLRHADGTIALDTVIAFPAGADSIVVTLDVKLLASAPTSGEPLSLNLAYINAAGDTVFKGGPVGVTATPSSPGSPAPPAVTIPVWYTGPGANAVGVQISPRSGTAVSGSSFNFTAVAVDQNGVAIANTPIVWNSLDPSIASIPSAASGTVLAGSTRGTARIVAQLLTGPTDQVTLNVLPLPTTIALQSGSGQSSLVGSTLANPLVAFVAASDGLGVSGVTVTFAVASGGGSVGTSSVVTNSAGLAQTTWQLGSTVGMQTATASSGTLSGSPVTFTATARPLAPTKLAVTAQPANATAGATLATVTIVAQTASGDTASAFTGAVTLTIAGGTSGATLGGTTTVNAIGGVATFSNLTVSRSGTSYSLVASSSGLTNATTNSFDIAAGPLATITVTPNPVSLNVNLTQQFTAIGKDASGNVVALTPVWSVAAGGGTISSSGLFVAGTVIGTFANTVTATSGGLSGTATVIVTGGGATQLKFTTQPTNATAATAIAPVIVVTAKDAGNNTANGFVGNVTLTFGANLGGATLSGTATVAAVAGIASFNNISLNKAAIGYTLNAASGALTPDISTAFNITAGPATTIAVSAGQAQSGLVSTVLATPLAVLVTDANANPVAGRTINWAITAGGGSVALASSVTNAAGIATDNWTLGAAAGPESVTATSAGLAGSPLTFTATATVATANKTWTGATNNVWATATNWSPAGVPAATDSVFIPVTANNPQLAANATVADLYIASGATLTLTSGAVTLGVNGALDATGGILGTGNVALTPPVSRSIKGSITAGTTTLFGPYSQNGSFIVVGNLVNNSGGSLVMNGNTTAVTGNFSTAGSGTLTMNNAADALTVTGNVTFGGGNETGLLTAGNLFVTGNFTQSSGSTTFVAAVAHTTTLNGTVAQTVNFANPFPSTFGTVVFANTAGVTLQTNMISNGAVTVSAGAVSGTAIGFTIGGTLTDPGALLAVPSISFTGSTTPVAATTPTINSSVTFNNNPSILAGNLMVNGAVNVDGNLQLNGHHLSVSGSFFTVAAGQLTMTNSTDSLNIGGNATFGGGVEAGSLTAGKMVLNGNFTQSNNGNGQEFKAVAGHLTVLTGSAAQTISFANPDTTLDTTCSNSCFGDLTINKSGGTVVYVTAADHRGTLTVMPGVTSVTATTSIVTVHGSTVTPASTAVHFASLGTFGSLAVDPVTLVDTIAFDGTAAQVIPAGTYNRTYIKGTPTVAAGGFSTTADLTVDGGNFALGGKGVVAGGNFVTQNGGKLTMTNANDSLFVSDSAIFNGGPEAGLLTAGQLYVYKAMSVAGAGQFSASGTHQTFLVGPQIICDCDRLIGLPGGFSAAGAKSRAGAIRAAAAPRRPTLARAPRAGALRLAGGVPSRNQLPPLTALALPNQPVTLAFGSTTGNSFGRLFIHGGVDWQTPAVVSDSAILDTNAFVSGVGRMIVAGSLVGSSSSRLLYLSSVELSGTGLGTFSDSGRFEADTTIWNGSNQLMPATVGPFAVGWRNIVVNSPTLRAYSDSAMNVNGSVVIQNSGQLRLGNAGWTTSMSVGDVFQTQGSGTLRMNDDPATVLSLSYGASFAGGSTAGLLTSGSLNVWGDFTQSGSATSFSASGSHTTTLQGSRATVSFTNPGTGATASHFANLVNANNGSVTFGTGLTLTTDVYADGVLSASSVLTDSVSFIGTGKLVAQGAAVSVGVSSAILNFHGVEFVLTDGATFSSFDGASFSAFTPTGTNFEFARSSGIYTLNNLIFNTAPSGGNLLNVSGATSALTIAHPFPAYPWIAGTQYVRSAGASVTVTP